MPQDKWYQQVSSDITDIKKVIRDLHKRTSETEKDLKTAILSEKRISQIEIACEKLHKIANSTKEYEKKTTTMLIRKYDQSKQEIIKTIFELLSQQLDKRIMESENKLMSVIHSNIENVKQETMRSLMHHLHLSMEKHLTESRKKVYDQVLSKSEAQVDLVCRKSSDYMRTEIEKYIQECERRLADTLSRKLESYKTELAKGIALQVDLKTDKQLQFLLEKLAHTYAPLEMPSLGNDMTEIYDEELSENPEEESIENHEEEEEEKESGENPEDNSPETTVDGMIKNNLPLIEEMIAEHLKRAAEDNKCVVEKMISDQISQKIKELETKLMLANNKIVNCLQDNGPNVLSQEVVEDVEMQTLKPAECEINNDDTPNTEDEVQNVEVDQVWKTVEVEVSEQNGSLQDDEITDPPTLDENEQNEKESDIGETIHLLTTM